MTNESWKEEQNQPELAGLYDQFYTVYRQVLDEFNIDEVEKDFSKKETRFGCTIFVIIAAALAVVIFTPVRWPWVVLGAVVIIIWEATRLGDWNLRYVKVFLERMEAQRKENPALFVRTLDQWVQNMPKTDRAKKLLESVVLKMYRGEYNGPQDADSPTAPAFRQPVDRDKMEMEPSPPPRPGKPKTAFPPKPGRTVPHPQPMEAVALAAEDEEDEENVEDAEDAEDTEDAEDKVDAIFCPRCGSDWIRAEEKTPGILTFICENCSKKWK